MSSDAQLDAPVSAGDLPIGELLVQRGVLQADDLARALEAQRFNPSRIGALLLRMGAVSEDNLLAGLSEQLGMPVLGRDVDPPSAESAAAFARDHSLDPDWLVDQQVVCWLDGLDGTDRVLYVHRDPLSPSLCECLQRLIPGRLLGPVLARQSDIARLVEATMSESDAGLSAKDAHQLRELASEAPVVELVSNVITQASEQRASDIHFEPEESDFVIRYRIDGVLHERHRFGRDRFPAVSSRLKLISGMDIAERRLPQDGRMSLRAAGHELDVRVSALPGVHGESIVMRLLPKERADLALDRLGMEADHLGLMTRWAAEANGIFLVTGPTGSGKSSTLYATLAASNDGLRKLITVEDPVEYRLPGITQIQAHAEIGLDFANALRSILRQDPDVIMVGEIRDVETARIAVQAALTGHLVFSTLHTNDAISAFPRLIDMGLEPYLVATPVKGVQAQRLVRRLCPQCKQPAEGSDTTSIDIRRWASLLYPGQTPQWNKPVGCGHCQGTGYRGRIGVYELVPVEEGLRHLVATGASAADLQAEVRRAGHRSLREDAMLKAWRGLTSVEEVLRVAGGLEE